jgi:hypothetical protein
LPRNDESFAFLFENHQEIKKGKPLQTSSDHPDPRQAYVRIPAGHTSGSPPKQTWVVKNDPNSTKLESRQAFYMYAVLRKMI